MANLELDPLFRRGLRLLHSRSRDSADQLKAILDEAIRQRKGRPIPSMNKDPFILRRESPIPRTKQGSPVPTPFLKTEMKRDLERKSREEDLVVLPKRSRLDSPISFKSSQASPSPTPSVLSESSSKSQKSDDSDSDAEMNDLVNQMGISCTVCKTIDVGPSNKLLDCQECHSIYHQECHKPPVSDQDVNDPRLVWYCAKCKKIIMKKPTGVVSSGSSNGSTSSSSGSVGESRSTRGLSGSGLSGTRISEKVPSPLSRSTSSPSKSLGHSRPSPFSNLTSGRSVGSGNSTGNGSSSGGKSSSSSSSSSSKTSIAPSAANSMLSAERRMHMMKKKAAAKMAEKRKML